MVDGGWWIVGDGKERNGVDHGGEYDGDGEMVRW